MQSGLFDENTFCMISIFKLNMMAEMQKTELYLTRFLIFKINKMKTDL